MAFVLLLLLERTDDEPLDLETLQCVYRFCGKRNFCFVLFLGGKSCFLCAKGLILILKAGTVLDDRYEK